MKKILKLFSFSLILISCLCFLNEFDSNARNICLLDESYCEDYYEELYENQIDTFGIEWNNPDE